MVNYQLGKIYKLVCNTTGLVYIGSTCESTLARRLTGHRKDYKRFKNGLSETHITSYNILENENYEIILIEDYPCNRKDELHARERFFIENNETVNKVIPNRTKQEYYEKFNEENNERAKLYRHNNPDKIKENNKKYKELNKSKEKEYNKEYRRKKLLEDKDYDKKRRLKLSLQNNNTIA